MADINLSSEVCLPAASGLRVLPRVTRKQIIITVPNRECLKGATIECGQCQTNFHRYLHVRSFDDDRMRGLFSEHGFECTEVVPIAAAREYFGLKAVKPHLRRLMGHHRQMFRSICPVCGFRDANQKLQSQNCISAKTHKGAPHIPALGRLLLKMWPKVPRQKWLMAVYHRAG